MSDARTEHERLRELLPLAVLAKLDPNEERAFSAHLKWCEECDSELRALKSEVGSAVNGSNGGSAEGSNGESVESAGPVAAVAGAPAHLERPRQAVGLALRYHGDLEGRWDRQRRLWRATVALAVFTMLIGARTVWSSVRIWRFVLLASLVALVAMWMSLDSMSEKSAGELSSRTAQIAALEGQITTLETSLEEARGEAETLEGRLRSESRLTRAFLNPDLRQTQLKALAPAPGATGFVILSQRHKSAVFTAKGLPPTAPTRTYQLWWITADGGPVKAALFSGIEGEEAVVLVPLPETKERLLGCAVTLESAQGASKPTGAMYLRGDFV